MTFFDRLHQGLARTKQNIVTRFDDIARRADEPDRRSRPVDIETVEALEELLISADVGVAAADRIVSAVKQSARNGSSLRDLVKRQIRDVFAAVEQLEIWAKRAQVDIIRAREGADPAAVVFDAISSGKAKGRDPILVDTAGRLHTRVNLMNELDKIRRVAAREVVGAPHEVLLVLDATVGQNGLVQAREFMNVAGVNGVVLTKLDGTAKGGIAVAIACELKLPIRYVGVGEAIDDLVPFRVDDYIDALFEQQW